MLLISACNTQNRLIYSQALGKDNNLLKTNFRVQSCNFSNFSEKNQKIIF